MIDKLSELNQLDRIEYLIKCQHILSFTIWWALSFEIMIFLGIIVILLNHPLKGGIILILGVVFYLICFCRGEKFKKQLDSEFFEVKPKVKKR